MRSFLTRTVAVTALALAPMAVLAQGGPNPGNGPGAGRDGGPGMGRDGGQRGGEGAGARPGQGGGGGRADAQGPRGGGAMQRDDHGVRGDDRNADRGDRGDRGRNADRDDHMRGGEMRRGDDDRGGSRDRVGERGAGERGMRRGPARVVTTEQRSRIRNVFRSRNIESIRGGDFAVRVGGLVPARYRFRPLPPDIVSFVPEYEGYDYVVVDDQILILDPEFHDIVAIIS